MPGVRIPEVNVELALPVSDDEAKTLHRVSIDIIDLTADVASPC